MGVASGIICGDNAVVHIMGGKAVQRAFGGHLLVCSV